jgi:hypothetical protein
MFACIHNTTTALGVDTNSGRGGDLLTLIFNGNHKLKSKCEISGQQSVHIYVFVLKCMRKKFERTHNTLLKSRGGGCVIERGLPP